MDALKAALTGKRNFKFKNADSDSDKSKMPPEPSQESQPRKENLSFGSKAEDLLALRTIIAMLSFIHSPNGRSPTETGPIGTQKVVRGELRVLDALSALLIRHHEITAVVAPLYNVPTSNLQVFASVVDPSIPDPELSLQPGTNSENPGFWTRFRNFTVSVNPRHEKTNDKVIDSLMNNTSLPLIRDCDDLAPEDLVTAAKGGASKSDEQHPTPTHQRL